MTLEKALRELARTNVANRPKRRAVKQADTIGGLSDEVAAASGRCANAAILGSPSGAETSRRWS
jgi:hypothetical protein